MRLAYDGGPFHGFQRQPQLRTVEGAIMEALVTVGAADDYAQCRFQGAARTDRGVNALGNVVALDTKMDPKILMRALNAICDDVFLYAIAPVPSDFNPRYARQRWYRYTVLEEGLDLDAMQEVGSMFEGVHDFIRFCHYDGKCTVRKVDEISVKAHGGAIMIDVRARDFLWNMVRRMASAMIRAGRGEHDVQQVGAALSGEPLDLGLAPARNLTLMDIIYDFEMESEVPITLKRKLTHAWEGASLRHAWLSEVMGRTQ